MKILATSVASIFFCCIYILCLNLAQNNNMICYCPSCLHFLPETLVDGVTFCQHCNTIITSNKANELIAAYKLIYKEKYKNLDQLKFHLQLSKEDMKYLSDCYEIEYFTIEEFAKMTKALYG